MAVVTTLSNLLTNLYGTSPNLLNPTWLNGDVPNIYKAKVSVANGDSSGSVYRICRLNSGDSVSTLKLVCDALGGSCAGKLGLYEVNSATVAESTAGNAALFVSSQSLVSAIAGVDQRWAVLTAATMTQRVWELLGLSADSKKNYDLCWTLTAASAAAGVLAMEVAVTH